MIFAGILRLMDVDNSLNLNRLALYAVGEEITRATFNKMKIAEELFPLTRIKSEPVDSSSTQAEASAPAPDTKVPHSVKGTIPSIPPKQTKPPHQAKIKRSVSPSKRKLKLASIIINPQATPYPSNKPYVPFVPINPKNAPPPSSQTQTQTQTQTAPPPIQTKTPPLSTSA